VFIGCKGTSQERKYPKQILKKGAVLKLPRLKPSGQKQLTDMQFYVLGKAVQKIRAQVIAQQ